MIKLGLMNQDSVDGTSHLPAQRILDLNREVVECRACPRLVEYRESVARVKKKQFVSWNYWGRPVPGFGDIAASILVIGLAPAPHGGNRTGRVFTGDRSADFLVKAFFEAGYANQPRSVDANDGLQLHGVYMTAAVKCVPPDNKPTTEEISNCAHFLKSELEICNRTRVILCLGQLAYRSTMVLLKQDNLFLYKIPKFEHGLEIGLSDGRKVFASYHPSPRNTQTGKLTMNMFGSLLQRINRGLGQTSWFSPPNITSS
jgi:uracil-DNA glycosylase family 4